MADTKIKCVTILGATGSVGSATIDILREQQNICGKDKVSVIALTANKNWERLARLALEFEPEFVALADETHLSSLRGALEHTNIKIGGGPAAILDAAAMDANWVMAAITGAAGLRSILVAAKRGCSLALANKESLVCAGSILMELCRKHGTTLLPVDSEHNAIFQVYDPTKKNMVERIILTASGGPFRTWDVKKIANATPKQAINHPTWSMGAKISVDSASLMNKGLELIEARHLFDASPSQLEVVIHPQSVVHGLVEYKDGSMLAQLGPPDMRVPIASAWAWPSRIITKGERLSLCALGRLDFESPDTAKFPALNLARSAMQSGGNACTILNAANEIAVDWFLRGKIKFQNITETVAFVLDALPNAVNFKATEPTSIEEVFEVDTLARKMANRRINELYC